jgi:cardiolipin synthase (CMP-forming)
VIEFIPGGEWVNIPNILTTTRFVLIPIFGMYLWKDQYGIAAAFFIFAGITDILDGYIARKYNMVTNWGKYADPVADKLMQITALVLLTMKNMIPVSILIIVIAKESLMVIGSLSLLKKENHVVSANWYGKMATVIFYIAIACLIIFNLKDGLLKFLLVWIAVLSTLFAFYMYYTRTYRKIRNESKDM